MAVKTRLRFAAATDPGKRRKNNEDRYYVDPERGIYAVIDGVGGQAAGETAAGVAVEVIRERLERQTGTPEDRLREAIALANNEILRLARSKPEWAGMACVLTVALVEDDFVTIGHVGDSRLYLLRPGEIVKKTHDHSPVGEREDRGEISEEEAMRHARRNEIYRDVGSGERKPDDPDFIEIHNFAMPSDGLLLLCSDGLTDLVSSAEILAGVERYAPDFDAAARALIEAANRAGGKDNITIVIVAGPEYGEASAQFNGSAKAYPTPVSRKLAWTFILCIVCGLAIGILAGLMVPVVWNRYNPTGPRTLVVGKAGITAALDQAHPGDTVAIPPGSYRERVVLREGVILRNQPPGTVTLISPDKGPALIARGMDSGGVEGIWVQGDPAAAGIEVEGAAPFISHVKVTGAGLGIDIEGNSAPTITASQITNNMGSGILVAAGATPRIEGNLIAANGNGRPDSARPGIEVLDRGHPLLKDNAIVNNGAEPIWIHGRGYQPGDYEENFFGGVPAKKAIRLIDLDGEKERVGR